MARVITRKERFYEKIPGVLSLAVMLLPLVGAIFFPVPTAYFIIVFNVYFLYKSISFFVLLIIAVVKIRTSENINWKNKVDEIINPTEGKEKLKEELRNITAEKFSDNKRRLYKDKTIPKFLDKFAFSLEKRKIQNYLREQIEKLEYLEEQGLYYDPRELHHVIMIPHWKEPYSVLEDTVIALSKQSFNTKQITILLAAEARDEDGVEMSEKLKAKYKHLFEDIWVSSHVMQDDDIIGKSSNMAWAGKHAFQEIAKKGWDLKYVTMTSCDADSLLHPEHFSRISHEYAIREDAHYKFYTGAVIFYSNIWRLKFYARVKNSISSLGNMMNQVRTDKLIPFSTYTTSFWLIDQIGYWTPWVTPEDYHVFFKSLFKFPDKVSTIPLFLKTMSDAAEGDTHKDTLKNNYFQQRRWAWGISIDGWMIEQTIKLTREGKLTLKAFYRAVHVIFDHIMGVAITVIIVLGGNIPYIVNPVFASTVLGSRLPDVSGFMVQITVWFLIGMVLVDHYFVKPKREYKNFFGRILGLLEWLVLPYVSFIIVFLPGIEAHTRLLFGKHLEYYLTKKK